MISYTVRKETITRTNRVFGEQVPSKTDNNICMIMNISNHMLQVFKVGHYVRLLLRPFNSQFPIPNSPFPVPSSQKPGKPFECGMNCRFSSYSVVNRLSFKRKREAYHHILSHRVKSLKYCLYLVKNTINNYLSISLYLPLSLSLFRAVCGQEI